MWDLLWAGSRRLDNLCKTQFTAQEASAIMAAVMLRQQRVMREDSVWELEAEGVIREMNRLVEEVESDL